MSAGFVNRFSAALILKLLLQTISSLAEVCYESAQATYQDSDVVPTYVLSSAFGTLVGKLLQVANRYVAYVQEGNM